MPFFTRKRMNIYFISLNEIANIPKEPPPFEVGTHYMKYTILDNVSTMFHMRAEEDIYSSVLLPSNELFFQVKKEKIQKLKIKEPVEKTNWLYYGDIFTDTKERIKSLKLKEPVVNSTLTDDW
jgi:hypothetical protein